MDPGDAEEQERRQGEQERRAKALQKANEQANSFSKLARDYIADKRTWKSRNRRIDDDAREIERDLIAEWGMMPITDIIPRHVRELIANQRSATIPTGSKSLPIRA